jgi:hypothetical protein
MFRPRHYAADVALELAQGLIDGTITLDPPAVPQTEKQLACGFRIFVRREVLGFAGFATLLMSFAAIVVKKLSPPGAQRSARDRQLAAQIKSYLNALRGNDHGTTGQGEVQKLEQQLARTHESSPQYWPTVFKLVTIKTQRTVDLGRLRRPMFQLDLDKLPSHLIFEGQIVILTGSGSLDACQFIDCMVSFDLKQPTFLYDVRFIRCSFFMPETAATSRPVQKVAATLLAARDTRDLSISISG